MQCLCETFGETKTKSVDGLLLNSSKKRLWLEPRAHRDAGVGRRMTHVDWGAIELSKSLS